MRESLTGSFGLVYKQKSYNRQEFSLNGVCHIGEVIKATPHS